MLTKCMTVLLAGSVFKCVTSRKLQRDKFRHEEGKKNFAKNFPRRIISMLNHAAKTNEKEGVLRKKRNDARYRASPTMF